LTGFSRKFREKLVSGDQRDFVKNGKIEPRRFYAKNIKKFKKAIQN
jgi:hypothetical protein